MEGSVSVGGDLLLGSKKLSRCKVKKKKDIVFKCPPYVVIWVNVKRRNKIPCVAGDRLEPTELNLKLIMVAKLVAISDNVLHSLHIATMKQQDNLSNKVLSG